MATLYNALLRCHHIRSHRKINKIKETFASHGEGLTFMLLRKGSCPGVMYVEGTSPESVSAMLDYVHDLRYKYFRVVCKPAPASERADRDNGGRKPHWLPPPGFHVVESSAEFGKAMLARGIKRWWLLSMGWNPKEHGMNKHDADEASRASG